MKVQVTYTETIQTVALIDVPAHGDDNETVTEALDDAIERDKMKVLDNAVTDREVISFLVKERDEAPAAPQYEPEW